MIYEQLNQDMAGALAPVVVLCCIFILSIKSLYVNNWRNFVEKKLMVKDLISYHIQVEQQTLVEQQKLVNDLVNFMITDTGCPIELKTVTVPFDRQLRNHARELELFVAGKPIAGSNFEAYDIRRLRNVRVDSIIPAPYSCEITGLDLWIVRFDHDCFVNIYGGLLEVVRIFGFTNLRGEVSQINDDTINTGKAFIEIDNAARTITHFGRQQVMQWIVTESSLLKHWKANGTIAEDINYLYKDELMGINAVEGHHSFENCAVLELRCKPGENKGISFALRNLDHPYNSGTLGVQLFIAATNVTHFR